MLKRVLLLQLLIAFVIPATGYSVTPEERLDDPVLEERARELSSLLRCLVCQNQSIDESDAPLAKDLRVLLRERLVAGESNGEIIDFLVSKYGEFILLKPRLSLSTLLLWSLTPIALLTGILAMILFYRRRNSKPVPEYEDALSEVEKERLRAIISSDPD